MQVSVCKAAVRSAHGKETVHWASAEKISIELRLVLKISCISHAFQPLQNTLCLCGECGSPLANRRNVIVSKWSILDKLIRGWTVEILPARYAIDFSKNVHQWDMFTVILEKCNLTLQCCHATAMECHPRGFFLRAVVSSEWPEVTLPPSELQLTKYCQSNVCTVFFCIFKNKMH